MPRRPWDLQQAHASALSVWPLGAIPSVAGGGGGGSGTSYAVTEGFVFDDDFQNGWSIGGGSGGTVVRQAAANSATNDQITILSHAIKWSGATQGQKIELVNSGTVDLDPFDALVFVVRDYSGSGQQFHVALLDASSVRINDFVTLTPPATPLSGRPGLVVRHGGDGFGSMKTLMVKLSAADAVLTASPFNGAWGGQGLNMPASGRTPAKYLIFEHVAAGTRSGDTYIDEIRFVRRVAANIPDSGTMRSGSATENGLGLQYLNYVAPTTLTRDTLPSSLAWAPDFLPYWQKVVDGLFSGGNALAGPTEQLLEHAARYWGMAPGYTAAYFYNGARNPSNTGGPPSSGIQGSATATNFRDIFKAQAHQESLWRQGFPSDWGDSQTLNGVTFRSYESFGIGQQRWPNWGPHRVPFLSTAMSSVFKGAVVRALFDGAIPEYHNLSPTPTGNIRRALLAYFEGTTGYSGNDQATYPSNILGASGGTPTGFINDVAWQTKSWPFIDTNTI